MKPDGTRYIAAIELPTVDGGSTAIASLAGLLADRRGRPGGFDF